MKRITSLLIILLIGVALDADAKMKVRKFYLTQNTFNGSQALTACADGYHMASLREIFDTTNLRYETELGLTADDSGFGPPDGSGWIRTGFGASNASIPGTGNCNAWTSDSSLDGGSRAGLPSIWAASGGLISPWFAGIRACSSSERVWCVQD